MDALPGGVPTLEPFVELLEREQTSIDDVRRLCFGGIPDELRATYWKLLLDYLPLRRSLRESELERKRKQYRIFLDEVTTRPGESDLDEAPLPSPVPQAAS